MRKNVKRNLSEVNIFADRPLQFQTTLIICMRNYETSRRKLLTQNTHTTIISLYLL